MGRPNPENTIANSITDSPNPLSLRILGFTGREPYRFSSDKPRREFGTLVWTLEYEYKPAGCPRDCPTVGCTGRNKPRCHSSRTVEFAHAPEGLIPRWLRVQIARWFTQCGIELVPPLPLPGMLEGHRLTLPGKAFLIHALSAGTSVEQLAEIMALSASSIYRFRNQYIPLEPLGLCIDPRMKSFGIDEIRIGGVWYTVLVDNTHHRFIALIRGTSESDIKDALIEIRTKCKIKRATMDFSRGYIAVVRKYFPRIEITGDKFHFVRRLREKLSGLLTAVVGDLAQPEIERLWAALQISPDQELDEDEAGEIEEKAEKISSAGLLKRERKLFLRKFIHLNQEERGAVRAWFDTIPRRQVLTGAARLVALQHARAQAPAEQAAKFSLFAKAVNEIPPPTRMEVLREAHRLLQRLYWLMNQKTLSPEDSQQRLHKTLYQFVAATRPRGRGITKFFGDHFAVISAYFETGETNAFSESFNRVVREILSASRRLSYEALNRKLVAWNRRPTKRRKFKTQKSGTRRDAKPLPRPSRHGLHRRREWPFERIENGGEQQLRLPF